MYRQSEEFDRAAKQDVVANPFTLEALIAWLETKPSDEKYNYGRPAVCLIGQWTGQLLFAHEIDELTFPGAADISFGGGIPTTWTFGAALLRARNALENRGA